MPRPPRDPEPDSLIGHFGAELRIYRMEAGLTMSQLGAALGCSPQWIGQVELGEQPSEAFAQDLDTFFKTGGSFHRLWKAIKRAKRARVLLPGFPKYLQAESKATLIRSFEPQLVPGLLQSERYARAVSTAGRNPSALEDWVAARLDRQQAILHGDCPPDAWFVLDEAVLHRPVGGADVMREQLKLLAGFAESRLTHVRVLPYSSVTYAALDGKFTILRLNDGSEVMYQEGPCFSQLIEDDDAVAEAGVRFDLVMGEALPRGESHRLILRALEDYK